MTDRVYRTCQDCHEYGEARMPVLIPAIAQRRTETGETAQEILDRYMGGVHERHLSGLSLAVTA